MTIYSPSGVVVDVRRLTRAVRNLRSLGFKVELDASAKARFQRFAGDDATRLAAIHRVAADDADIAMASKGGYGLTRLLDFIDYSLIARSIDRGKRWVGYSDQTAFQMAVLAHTGRSMWAGPMAVDDFGLTDEEGGVDDVTSGCYVEAMTGSLEALGFRTSADLDGLSVQGLLWGGNLTMLLALLGTPHWPRVTGGILLVEDVNETPYRIERGLLQLHQAGVLAQQRAILLGSFSGYASSPVDRGYSFKSAVKHLRALSGRPIVLGFPFGHVQPKVCIPFGRHAAFSVLGRNAWLRFET